MHCDSPIPSVPSFKRHIVFRVVDQASGKECVFADPKDVPGALGEELMGVTDTQPYAWKKCLRLPGSPGGGAKRPYHPVGGFSLSDARVYAEHCVCVSGTNAVVHGVHPNSSSSSMASNLFFPSEISVANLIFNAIRRMCPVHDVKIGSSSLDAGDPEARTVWQRIEVKCTAPQKSGKLLDMTHFCEKMLVPVVVSGGEPKRLAVSLKHKNGNNSWLNFVFGVNEDAGSGYLCKVQFKVKGTQRKALRSMLECELRSFHLHRIAVAALGSIANASAWLNAHKAKVALEKACPLNVLCMDSAGHMKKRTCDLYEIRNALRRRLRARRVRERVRLFKCKRSRGAAASGGFEKYQDDKTKYWEKNMAKIDTSTDLGRVLGFVVSYCSTTLANKVLEIETDHVTGSEARLGRQLLQVCRPASNQPGSQGRRGWGNQRGEQHERFTALGTDSVLKKRKDTRHRHHNWPACFPLWQMHKK